MTTSGTVSPSVESSRKQESPLSGIRAIELGAFQQAPLAARWLAEAGAEVIKIEGLPGGDPTRGVQTMVGRGRPADSHNWIHEYLNRNKKSVGLYLDNERAREVVYKLVRNSDVFVTNLREPTLEKWGVTFEALAEVNPRLIYARGTGLGTTGAEAGKPALDMIGQARSGLLSVVGDLESFSMKGGLSPCDKVSSLQLAFAVSLALVARERTGRGQKVDASLLGAGIYLLAHEMQYFTGTGTQTAVVNRKGVANPLRNTY
ncbi:MAG: CoA transferase, partial [Chloroflexi bacterium]|nr:CoA transferase [Chloroflexota bacterium]